MIRGFRSSIKKYTFILPLSAGIFIFLLFPLLEIFLGSLSFESYKSVITNDAFWMAIRNTARFSIFTYILLMIGCLWMASKIIEADKYAMLIFSCILLPYVLPVATVVQVWKIFFAGGGVVGEILYMLGMGSQNILETGSAFYVVILLFLWRNGGLFTLIFYYGLKSIPKEYYEVASIEGASTLQKLWHITLLCLIPFIFFNTILFMINGFKIYREIYMLSGEYPDQSVYMIQHYLNNLFTAMNFSKLSCSTIIFLLGYSFILFIVYRIVAKRTGDMSL